MLSNKDIARTLGKGIIINPFNKDNVEGASIYLTASKLAWSSKEGNCIYHDNKITIPPNDTAVIITNEFVQLNNRYAATCHARLSLTMKGLSYYATPIKPDYKGKLIIFLQNNTNTPIEIMVNERIVTVMFYKLLSKTSFTKDIVSSPDAYLFSTNRITMNEAQRSIYNEPKHPNDSDNKKLYKELKGDKRWIFDIAMIILCGCIFITILILIYKLPQNCQNIKDIIQIISPFAGGGFFTLLYKQLRS